MEKTIKGSLEAMGYTIAFGYTAGVGRKKDDGGRRMGIIFGEQDGEVVHQKYDDPNLPVAVILLADEAKYETVGKKKPEKKPSLYGNEAQKLIQSPFFRTVAVWKAIGTDDDLKKYTLKQDCCHCLKEQNPELDIVAHHVRKVKDGSGMGIKGEYIYIPLCALCHAKLHTGVNNHIFTDEYLSKKKIDHISKWAKETLKDTLGYQSLTEIPPIKVAEWAVDNDLYLCLPQTYKVIRFENEAEFISVA